MATDHAGNTTLLAKAVDALADDSVRLFDEPAMYRKVSTAIRQSGQMAHLAPHSLARFMVKLCGNPSVQTVMDPACGTGMLLRLACEHLSPKRSSGIEQNTQSAELARKVASGAEIVCADSFTYVNGRTSRVDRLICEPPFGGRLDRPVEFAGATAPQRQLDEAFVCLACTLLAEGGRAVLLVPPKFVFSSSRGCARKQVENLGCRLDACIYVPGGVLQQTALETYVIVVSEGTENDGQLFVAQYADDETHQNTVIDNLNRRRAGKTLEQGRLVVRDDFRGFSALAAREQIERDAQKRGLVAVRIGDIACNITRTDPRPDHFARLDHVDNSVYIPRHSTGRAAETQDELSSTLRDYLKIEIDPDHADARYVIRELNSPAGRQFLQSVSHGSTIQRIDTRQFREATIYLAPLSKQREVMAINDRLDSLQADIQTIRDLVWRDPENAAAYAKQIEQLNREERYDEWIETLPFPLASILWRHHALVGDPKQSYETLLHFFEALAEFVAMLLLSGTSSDPEWWGELGPGLEEALKKQHLSYQRATFGTWKCTVEYLAKRCRDRIERQGDLISRLFGTRDVEMIRLLSDSRLCTILQETNQKRNAVTGHGGIISNERARLIHDALFHRVTQLRELFGCRWSEYELIDPKQGRYIDGLHHYRARRLMGTRSVPFPESEYQCSEPLDDRRLFMLGKNCTRAMELIPIIRVLPTPQSQTQACYFYNRTENDGRARYVSYHYDGESDVVASFEDVTIRLKALFSSG